MHWECVFIYGDNRATPTRATYNRATPTKTSSTRITPTRTTDTRITDTRITPVWDNFHPDNSHPQLVSVLIFYSKCEICPEDIFVLARRNSFCGHRSKISHENFSLDCRWRSFTLRVASTWNSLPDDVVALET